MSQKCSIFTAAGRALVVVVVVVAALAGGAPKEKPVVPIVGADVVAGVGKVKREVGAVVVVDTGVEIGKREGAAAVVAGVVVENPNPDGVALVVLVVMVAAAAGVANDGKAVGTLAI